MHLKSFLTFCFLSAVFSQDPPTLYEHYTSGEITSGLSVAQPHFTLNGKNITLYSGTIHYFRVPSGHWRDRLRKLRAAGLNAVETYVAWNMHEPENGVYDFGSGGTDMEGFLDIRKFLKIAQEEDLFVILRPGPYICSEFEWGGFPSWLLAEDGAKVRTSEAVYMKYVARYYEQFFAQIVDLQFTNGGPIIAVQVENEYGYAPEIDLDYIQQLVDIFKKNGVVEVLFTSDGAVMRGTGSLPEILFQTINFAVGSELDDQFGVLEQYQPGKPYMAMEFWTGWFDYWADDHNVVATEDFKKTYEAILSYPASVNLYMFEGGTNWGYYNGAGYGADDDPNYQVVTTSYDYDSPLSEAGDYREKYFAIKDLIAQYNPVKTLLPELPELVPRIVHPSVTITSQIKFTDLIETVSPVVFSLNPLPMEQLGIHNGSGQSFGYTVYRKEMLNLPAGSVLTIKGHVRDTLMVLVNGALISNPLTSSQDFDGFGYWRLEESSIILTAEDLTDATIDLVVETWGRCHGGPIYYQNKGLGVESSKVYLNDEELNYWIHFPLEFKKSWTNSLEIWESVETITQGPALYRGILTVEELRDSYIDMRGWSKGMVIVNGFVLGKYSLLGPQQNLYLPGPFLREGDNEIVIFEHFTPREEIVFAEDQQYIHAI